jgi:hypothetical protein
MSSFIIDEVLIIPFTGCNRSIYDDFETVDEDSVPEIVSTSIKENIENKNYIFKYEGKVYKLSRRGYVPREISNYMVDRDKNISIEEFYKIKSKKIDNYYNERFEIISTYNIDIDVQRTYNKFEKNLNEIVKLCENKTEVKLEDLPITNVFRDFSKINYLFNDAESCFELNILGEGPNLGRAGGATTIVLANIGKFWISQNNKRINSYCKHCETFKH